MAGSWIPGHYAGRPSIRFGGLILVRGVSANAPRSAQQWQYSGAVSGILDDVRMGA